MAKNPATRLAVVAALLPVVGAMAEPATDQPPLDVEVFRAPVTKQDVGRFLRDKDGYPIGSVYAIHGDQVTVWVGFMYLPGNHLVTVPLSAIQPHGGRLEFDEKAWDRPAR